MYFQKFEGTSGLRVCIFGFVDFHMFYHSLGVANHSILSCGAAVRPMWLLPLLWLLLGLQ
jgi:hypothetical protein